MVYQHPQRLKECMGAIHSSTIACLTDNVEGNKLLQCILERKK
jgi:hypothetical protein